MNIEELDILKELSEQTYFGDFPFLYYADLIGKLLTAYEKEKEKNKEYEKQLDLDYAEEKIKEAYIDGTNVAHNLCNKKWVEIIQTQIQELENERKDLVYAQPFVDGQIGVLKRVLKRGEE